MTSLIIAVSCIYRTLQKSCPTPHFFIFYFQEEVFFKVIFSNNPLGFLKDS